MQQLDVSSVASFLVLGSGILRVLGKKYIKRLLTVNTIVLYEAPKANLKVMIHDL